jgi:hypothetical protein
MAHVLDIHWVTGIVGVSDPGDPQPSRPVNFIAACPCPDGLAQDETQGEMRLVLSRTGGACSRGYKRCSREREPVRFLVPRATPRRCLPNSGEARLRPLVDEALS